MPIPRTIYENNDKAAHAISEYVSPHRFALRPFNRFDAAFTEWWFVPNRTEWPAYRHSKLFVHMIQLSPNQPQLLYAGYYVEHGLGGELAGMSGVHKKHIMQPDWYWHDFLRHAKRGELNAPIQQVHRLSQCRLWISVNAYAFNQVPELDTYRLPPADAVEYAIPSETADLQLTQPSAQTLEELNDCVSLQQLAAGLEMLEGLGFFWVDVLIGIRLGYGTRTSGTWDGANIWNRALAAWEAWVE